jgi:Fic family protein
MPKQAYSINPDRSKPWNELPLLPIAEELYKTTEILEQLGEAKMALAQLKGRSIAIPNQALLINSISLQEAKASSEIENIFTTDDELYKAFSEKETVESIGAPKEILRYREALWKGFDYLNKKQTFDANYFIEIYQEIKQASDGFRPAFVPTIIRQGGSGVNAGKVSYTPPRGKGIVEAKMENLIEFMNDDQQYKIDPLLKMVMAHYQFEAIHPFRDGNGRTGRIFNIHYLTLKGLLDYPILFLSKYINQHKDDYYYCLSGVSERGDWKNWILYLLKAVEETAKNTYDKINDILAAKEAILNVIQEESKIRKPEKLVESIFTQPFTKTKHLTDAKIYAENTARNYLNKLCEMGVLEQKTISGHHYYLNLELYRILSE